MRIAIWSPLPPSPSGVADYVDEQLPVLREAFEVVTVPEKPPARPDVDIDLYHLGNSPAHGYAYRAALERPGVVVLHEWCLHHLVLAETLGAGDVSAYLREMRRAHGEMGTFVGRQVARGLGGDLLPALFPLNDRVLDVSLAVVGLTEYVAKRAALRLGRSGRPVLRLRHHLSLPGPPPSRSEARRALGLPLDAFVVTAPGLATASKRLDVVTRVIARLRSVRPSLRLVVAGATDPQLPLREWIWKAGLADAALVTGRLEFKDFVAHLAAADAIVALRFPTHGEISGALIRALGVGRAALVTAGTPAAEEFPEGVVVPVDPDGFEEEELMAFLLRFADDARLREAVGDCARRHVTRLHDLKATAETLAAFVEEVAQRKDALFAATAPYRAPEGSLLAYLTDEVRQAALDLGLSGVPLGCEALLQELAGGEADRL